MKPAKEKGTKKKFGRKPLFFLNFVLLMIPVTYFGYQPLLRYSASALIIDTEPKKVDAIVLLSGGEPGRAWGAAELYQEKWAPYIVITREQLDADTVALRNHGIEVATTFDNNMRILRGFGVPSENIVPLDRPVNSTSDEMFAAKELAERKNWKSLIFVTSNYHTRRSRLLARYHLGSEIDVTVIGSRHGGLNRDTWWQNRTDQRTFLIEFQKLVAYTLYIWPRLIL